MRSHVLLFSLLEKLSVMLVLMLYLLFMSTMDCKQPDWECIRSNDSLALCSTCNLTDSDLLITLAISS